MYLVPWVSEELRGGLDLVEDGSRALKFVLDEFKGPILLFWYLAAPIKQPLKIQKSLFSRKQTVFKWYQLWYKENLWVAMNICDRQ